MLKKLKNRKGVSLLELIIVIAILSLVITMIYSIYNYGGRTFDKGNSQYSVQSDIRLSMDYIVDETRYATKLNLTDIPTESILTSSQGIDFIYVENNKLVHKDWNDTSSTHETRTFASTITNYSFTSDGDDLLEILLTGVKDNENY